MQGTLPISIAEQDQRIEEIVRKDGTRLGNFIRSRVPSKELAEDVLQDVLYQLLGALRVDKEIENVSAWLFSVARNRITDLFRKKKALAESDFLGDDGTSLFELLPSADDGPEAAFARNVLLSELEAALAELPIEQQWAFEQNEIAGKNFKELSEESGETVNTLISRKRYAVLHLRKRLQQIYNEFKNEY